ncbi:MAG: WalW protein [Sphingomonas sp.]
MTDDGSRHLPASAFRLARPSPEALVAWPEDFGTRFTVFVDTEEEFDWRGPFNRGARATTAAAALPAAHHRFADHGTPLTFLIDHPIVSDPAAVAHLQAAIADGRSAVGAQLHPWVNPPFDEEVSSINSFPGNLPATLEGAKIAVLTAAIADAFGRHPRIYRAGRYGIGPNTARLLAAQGYVADSSVRSRYDYSASDGPDFRAVGNAVYRFGPDNILLELPLTTVFAGMARGGGQRLYHALSRLPKALGAAARAGLLSRVALTPEQMPIADATEAIRVAVGQGLRLLNFSFHSPSLVPGHTPYVRDGADLAAFWRWWDEVLALLAQLGVASASLDELLAVAAAQPPSLPQGAAIR